MVENFWQDVYSHPPLAGLTRCNDADVFEWTAAQLPVTGSAIDWSRVTWPHAHQLFENDAELQAAAAEALLLRLAGDRRAQHGGDSLSPFGVWVDSSGAGDEAIRALLTIPEHHYFLAKTGLGWSSSAWRATSTSSI